MRAVFPTHRAPESFFTRLRVSTDGVCFFNSSTDNGWQKTIAWNPSASFVYKRQPTKSGDTLKEIKNFVQTQGRKRRKIAGYFSYDFGSELSGIAQKARDDLRLPDVYLLAYDNWVDFEKHRVIA
jgi:anthranilate/para-aminobenzoate synthase component I